MSKEPLIYRLPVGQVRALSSLPWWSAGGIAEPYLRRLVADLAPALCALYAAGRIHGALSPDTIGLDDAGCAHLLSAAPTLWHRRPSVPDDQRYEAPECVADETLQAAGVWSDIYALGAVIYRAMTGHEPVSADDRQLSDPMMSPGRDASLVHYPPFFVTAVRGALSLSPARRWRNLNDFAKALGLPDSVGRMPPLLAPVCTVAPQDSSMPSFPKRVAQRLGGLVVGGAAAASALFVTHASDDAGGRARAAAQTGSAVAGARVNDALRSHK